MNFWRTGKLKNRTSLFLVLCFFGCAVPQRRVVEPLRQEPTTPPASEVLAETHAARKLEMAPVVLVFGPGLARGFAYIGVLEAFYEAKIPVAAIVGVEMGALVASLYALHPNINAFEWSLFQFKQEDFKEAEGFFAKFKTQRESDGAKLKERLKQVFGSKKIEDSKIPLRIGLQSKDLQVVSLLNEGKLDEVLRAALAVPGVLTPSPVLSNKESILMMSSGSHRPFPVKEAKELHLGPVVVVDVMTGVESRSSQKELEEADFLLRPELTQIGYLNFEKRRDATFQGKLAVQKELTSLLEAIDRYAKEQHAAPETPSH